MRRTLSSDECPLGGRRVLRRDGIIIDLSQRSTIRESITLKSLDLRRNRDSCQRDARIEGTSFDGGHTDRDFYICKRAAVIERTFTDACNTRRKLDICKLSASRKSICTNACNAVRKLYGCKTTFIEGFITNGRYGICNFKFL